MKYSDEALENLRRLSNHLSAVRGNVVIDADTHLTDTEKLSGPLRTALNATPDYYHGRPVNAEDLLRELTMARVDMALIWQNPAATPYTADQNENFARLMGANRYIFEIHRKYPDRFIPAGWTDPEALGVEKALEVVDRCICEFGFPVVKMNPAQNAYPITSEKVKTITERISGYGAVTAFHYGADTPYTPADGMEKVARTFPQARFLAVHMGGGGAGYVEAERMYLDTRAMGLRNPNIHFIVSAKRDTHFESDFICFQAAGDPFSLNMSCGSDAPYGRMSWNFGGYRAMFASLQDSVNHTDPRIRSGEVVFDNAAVQNFMGGNLADLIITAIEEMISS